MLRVAQAGLTVPAVASRGLSEGLGVTARGRPPEERIRSSFVMSEECFNDGDHDPAAASLSMVRMPASILSLAEEFAE